MINVIGLAGADGADMIVTNGVLASKSQRGQQGGSAKVEQKKAAQVKTYNAADAEVWKIEPGLAVKMMVATGGLG